MASWTDAINLNASLDRGARQLPNLQSEWSNISVQSFIFRTRIPNSLSQHDLILLSSNIVAACACPLIRCRSPNIGRLLLDSLISICILLFATTGLITLLSSFFCLCGSCRNSDDLSSYIPRNLLRF